MCQAVSEVIFACINSAAHINGIIHIIHEFEEVMWQDDLLYITGKLIMTLSRSLSVRRDWLK